MKSTKDFNRFLYKDPKGRDPFGPPYIFFHRFHYETNHAQWMDRIDALIEEKRKKNSSYSGIDEVELILITINVILFVADLFLAINYLT